MGNEPSKRTQNLGGGDLEEDNGNLCVPPDEHAYTKKFKCDQTNCMSIICKKCMGAYGSSGQRYCILCALNI